MKNTEPSAASVGMLAALNRKARHIYGGTVDPVTVVDRRRRNKAARQSRRINRRSK